MLLPVCMYVACIYTIGGYLPCRQRIIQLGKQASMHATDSLAYVVVTDQCSGLGTNNAALLLVLCCYISP